MKQNKPVIGILPTYNLNNEKNDPYMDRASFVRMYVEKVRECGGIPIGLLDQDISLYKDICNGYLWPGGSKIWKEFNVVIQDCLEKKKPLIGVCLGAQAIATFFNVLEDKKDSSLSFEEIYQSNKEKNPYLIKAQNQEIHNHDVTKEQESISKARHKIKIEKNSFLYSIYKQEEIEVVSLHEKVIPRVSEKLLVSAKSTDGIIEALEYHEEDNKILGVQFHPEIEEYSNIFSWLVETSKENGLKRTKH